MNTTTGKENPKYTQFKAAGGTKMSSAQLTQRLGQRSCKLADRRTKRLRTRSAQKAFSLRDQ